jgi:hypothetical protein
VQAVAAVLEIGELALAGHAVHALAPGAPENFPASQAAHDAFPVAILYVPARHCVQLPPFAPEKPALQVHAASAELEMGELEPSGHCKHILAPDVEYVPAPQFIHEVVPVPLVNFPATHSVHVPPLTPDEPALQVQSTSAVLETGEFELPGHDVHAALPVMDLYLPATHPVQFCASNPPLHTQLSPS